MTEADFMRRAIALAWRSAGHTRPNPPVGAVVVKGGRIVGEGRHRRCGGDHAEVAALKVCTSSPKGAAVYVTLEPCSKPGRVGACCDALIAAGVKRVVWACADPNPANRGKAARVLRRAGVETAHGLCEAREVLYRRGLHQLPAGEHAFHHKDVEPRARGVDRRRKAHRPAADYRDVCLFLHTDVPSCALDGLNMLPGRTLPRIV